MQYSPPWVTAAASLSVNGCRSPQQHKDTQTTPNEKSIETHKKLLLIEWESLTVASFYLHVNTDENLAEISRHASWVNSIKLVCLGVFYLK